VAADLTTLRAALFLVPALMVATTFGSRRCRALPG